MSHRFVWVDIPVHDLDRAIAFYAAVLGTAVTREGGPGFSFGLLAHSGSDVAGCLYLAARRQRAVAARAARLPQRRRTIADAERAVAGAAPFIFKALAVMVVFCASASCPARHSNAATASDREFHF